MKNKILVLLAVVVSAGLVMAWGCGGKATLGSGTEEVSGTPVPIIITAGLNGGEAAGSVSKDVTAWGDFGSQGMLESQGESADAVNCWFTWETDTAIGLRPVITLVAKGAVYNECLAAGKDPNNCIGCMNDENPLTPESANLYCEGIVPPGVSDQIDAVAHCTFTFNVDDFTVGKARVIEKAWRTVDTMVGWPELDELIYDGATTSIMDNILLNSLLLGSRWDFSLADGNPATETTMSAASDPVNDVPTLPVGAASEKLWVKYLTFTAKGSGPTQTIVDTRDIVTPVQFVIPNTPASSYEWNKDRVYISQTFCTNIDDGCDVPEVRSVAAAMFSITGVDTLPLVSNATDDFSIITISYLGEPLLAQMTATNYELDLVSPLPGEDAIATMRTYDDEELESYIYITDAYKFQLEDFYAVARNVEIMSAGQILSLAAPYVLENMELACAGSDVFKVDSLIACHTNVNAMIASDATLEEAIAADLVVHVPDASLLDPELGKISFDSSKFSGGDKVFSFGKNTMKVLQPGGSVYMTTAFSDIANFDSFTSLVAGEKDAVYVMMYDSISGTGFGYGIEAYVPLIAHTSTVTTDIEFTNVALIDGTVNGVAIAQTSCANKTHFECITALAGAIKGSDKVSSAEVDLVDDNVINVVGLNEGETLTIALVVTVQDPAPTLTQATVSGPVGDLRKDIVGFGYDSNAALQKFTSGARIELVDNFVSLQLSGKHPNYEIQYLANGQWVSLTSDLNPSSIAYDKHYPQIPNSPVGKTLLPPSFGANYPAMVFFFDSLDADTGVSILDNTLINVYILDQVIGPTQGGMSFDKT